MVALDTSSSNFIHASNIHYGAVCMLCRLHGNIFRLATLHYSLQIGRYFKRNLLFSFLFFCVRLYLLDDGFSVCITLLTGTTPRPHFCFYHLYSHSTSCSVVISRQSPRAATSSRCRPLLLSYSFLSLLPHAMPALPITASLASASTYIRTYVANHAVTHCPPST